jgi:hypothetical protein
VAGLGHSPIEHVKAPWLTQPLAGPLEYPTLSLLNSHPHLLFIPLRTSCITVLPFKAAICYRRISPVAALLVSMLANYANTIILVFIMLLYKTVSGRRVARNVWRKNKGWLKYSDL